MDRRSFLKALSAIGVALALPIEANAIAESRGWSIRFI